MKTAEVAVEHVLTGLLALCAFLLPLLPALTIDLIVIVGLAYVFGVVFDKIADAVLSPIEQRLRLRLASEFLKEHHTRYDDDPFPQDILEFSLRGDKNGRVEWMDSLRSRIRTTRGMAVLGLPAALGIAIYFYSRQPLPQISYPWSSQAAVVLNLIFLFAAIVVSSFSFKKTAPGFESLIEILKPIRTDKLVDKPAEREAQLLKATKRMVLLSSFYALMMINSLLMLAFIAARRSQSVPVTIILGTTLMIASLWVWYTITETHMKFIYNKLRELPRKEDSNGGTVPTVEDGV
jgi:hypothetical protein